MSREIKFRAWHETSRDYSKGKSSNMFQWIEEGQPVELEQYTGSKDKNGVEIYEGDILSFGIDAKFQRGVVIFHKGGFKFDKNNPFFPSKRHMNDVLCKSYSNSKIIGNVHQNKHLLEECK